ncbi:MAG: glycosyltransferase family 2 protein [Microthrixaceae bacterium]
MPGEAPRVSVVIPCYNSLRWLPETMQRVLSQSFADFEAILVDDGGDDDLAGWVESLGDPRVRVVRQDNAGVSAARNRGIDEARGELVAFLDSDDLWFAHTLGALVGRYDEVIGEGDGGPRVGLVYGWYQVADEAGSAVGRTEAYEVEGDAWEGFVVSNPVGPSATLVPKAVLVDVGGFEVNRDEFPVDVEDWELWIRIAAAGYRVALVRDVLYLYRRHDSNSSVDVASLDKAYRRLLAKVFEGQPPLRRSLLPRAVARVDMILAWQSLNDLRDAQMASAYRRSARRHFPGARREVEYWRLGLAIAVARLMGQGGFDLVRSSAGGLRRVFGLTRS